MIRGAVALIAEAAARGRAGVDRAALLEQARVHALGARCVALSWVAYGLQVAGDVVDAAGEGPYCAWVRAGRRREERLGLTPEHPEAWFLSSTRGPHFPSAPCTCPDDDRCDVDSDATDY